MPVEAWIYIAGAPVFGWIAARLTWENDERDQLTIGAALLWPVVFAVLAVLYLLWLFLESAKPGRVETLFRRIAGVLGRVWLRLPRLSRRRADPVRIAELEAEVARLEAETAQTSSDHFDGLCRHYDVAEAEVPMRGRERRS